MEKFDWRYVTLFVLILVWSVNGGIEGVIKVNYKFSGSERNLRALKAHDEMRHLRILAGIDLPIGGIGRPDSVGSAFPFYSALLLNWVYACNSDYICICMQSLSYTYSPCKEFLLSYHLYLL